MKQQALLSLFAALAILQILGCSRPEDFVEQAQVHLREFRAEPNAERQAAVETSLTRLQEEVRRLESRGESTKAQMLQEKLETLRAEFAAAKIAGTVLEAQRAVQGFGEAVREAAKSFTEAFKTNSSEE